MAQLSQCIRAGSNKGESGYLIGFDYDADLVEKFKLMIPHTEREWRPTEKVWWVSIKYEPVLNGIFRNFDALAHKQGQMF